MAVCRNLLERLTHTLPLDPPQEKQPAGLESSRGSGRAEDLLPPQARKDRSRCCRPVFGKHLHTARWLVFFCGFGPGGFGRIT